MPTLPITKMTLPSVLTGQPNGQLPAALLTTIRMPGGGTAIVLTQAAPKWNALLTDAAAAGFAFLHQGDYRPLAEQIALLKDRYIVVTSGGSITWDGKLWRKKPGLATVAPPGRSNHGWGLALDLAVRINGQIVSLTTAAGAAALAWLIANAHRYGISAEIQSEAWHWRPYDGDKIAPAVLAHTTPQEEDMATLVRHKDGKAVYVSTFTVCRWVQGEAELKALLAAGLGPVQVVTDLTPYGLLVGPAFTGDAPQPLRLTTTAVDVPALAAELAPLLTAGTVPPHTHSANVSVGGPKPVA